MENSIFKSLSFGSRFLIVLSLILLFWMGFAFLRIALNIEELMKPENLLFGKIFYWSGLGIFVFGIIYFLRLFFISKSN